MQPAHLKFIYGFRADSDLGDLDQTVTVQIAEDFPVMLVLSGKMQRCCSLACHMRL